MNVITISIMNDILINEFVKFNEILIESKVDKISYK